MAILQAELKRGFLRSLYRAATSATPAVTLINALNAFQDAQFPLVKSGRLIVSTSGNAHGTSFKIPDSMFQLTQDQVFALSEEFIQTYTDAKANLILNGNATPTDDDIFAAMIAADNLQTIREYQNDYTATRFPVIGPGVST